jgi:hypothetical protein
LKDHLKRCKKRQAKEELSLQSEAQNEHQSVSGAEKHPLRGAFQEAKTGSDHKGERLSKKR